MGPEGILAPSFQSSILYLGPASGSLNSLGVEFTDSIDEVQRASENHLFKVILVDYKILEKEPSIERALYELKVLSPKSQIILVGNDIQTELSIPLFNQGLIQFVSNKDDTEIQEQLKSAIGAFNSIEQDDSFFQLFDEQNERLSTLKTRLEERVIKRQKFLNSARSKLSITDRNVGLLHKCFVSIHGSQSFQEIEKKLLTVLQEALQIQEIQILIESEETTPSSIETKNMRTLSYPLMAENREFGGVQFSRDIRQPYSEQEDNLLSQVSGAISLAATRLLVLQELERLTNQWETTFNSISDPLCLLDTQNKIIRGNASLGSLFQLDLSRLNGKNPFELLNISGPEDNTIESWRKRVDTEVSGENYTFDVIVQNLSDMSQTPVVIVIFRDVTQTAQLEKQALESSKLAELGIIGSSIAHELNNPLGGIINFLQLIKMDIDESHTYFDDIQEMEKAAARCKQIVENLLGFSRKEDSEESGDFELATAIDQAIKICEIQTKSKGISVTWNPNDFSMKVNGNKNQWIQVMRNLLQNSIDAIERKTEKSSDLQGKIEISTSTKSGKTQIQIHDNGDGIEEKDMPLIFNPLFSRKEGPNSTGLGLTVAFRILNEHHANLFYKSVPLSGTTAIISLKSPEIQGSSQVFDTKI